VEAHYIPTTRGSSRLRARELTESSKPAPPQATATITTPESDRYAEHHSEMESPSTLDSLQWVLPNCSPEVRCERVFRQQYAHVSGSRCSDPASPSTDNQHRPSTGSPTKRPVVVTGERPTARSLISNPTLSSPLSELPNVVPTCPAPCGRRVSSDVGNIDNRERADHPVQLHTSPVGLVLRVLFRSAGIITLSGPKHLHQSSPFPGVRSTGRWQSFPTMGVQHCSRSTHYLTKPCRRRGYEVAGEKGLS